VTAEGYDQGREASGPCLEEEDVCCTERIGGDQADPLGSSLQGWEVYEHLGAPTGGRMVEAGHLRPVENSGLVAALLFYMWTRVSF
jgi:hypothetical protein